MLRNPYVLMTEFRISPNRLLAEGQLLAQARIQDILRKPFTTIVVSKVVRLYKRDYRADYFV